MNAELVKEQLAVITSMPLPLSKENAAKLRLSDVRKGGFLKFREKFYFVKEVGTGTRSEKDNSTKKETYELMLFSLVDDSSPRLLVEKRGDEQEIFISEEELNITDFGFKDEELQRILSGSEFILNETRFKCIVSGEGIIRIGISPMDKPKGSGTPYSFVRFADEKNSIHVAFFKKMGESIIPQILHKIEAEEISIIALSTERS